MVGLLFLAPVGGGSHTRSLFSFASDQGENIKTSINTKETECLEPGTCAVPPAHRGGENGEHRSLVSGVPLCSLWSMTAENSMGLELIFAQAQSPPKCYRCLNITPLGPLPSSGVFTTTQITHPQPPSLFRNWGNCIYIELLRCTR